MRLGVKCGWADATAMEIAQYPDSAVFHQVHTLAQCDAWKCLDGCGNEAGLDGFHPCNEQGKTEDADGKDIQPTADWPGLYVCGSCGKILTAAGEVYREAPTT